MFMFELFQAMGQFCYLVVMYTSLLPHLCRSQRASTLEQRRLSLERIDLFLTHDTRSPTCTRYYVHVFLKRLLDNLTKLGGESLSQLLTAFT